MQYDIDKLFLQCLSRENDTPLSSNLMNSIGKVVEFSEKQKGVLTVIVTGLVYKYFHPEQDVRLHQTSLPDGYSGRTFDTKNITPFLRKHNFPCMAESGWLTRSLEQKVPYDEDYTGSISGKGLKQAFLHIYSETENVAAIDILTILFKKMVSKRDESAIQMSSPANLTVIETLDLIKNHFNYGYKNVSGASRLPNLAIYAAYKSIIGAGYGRYKGVVLSELDSHTSSDKSTKSIGDVQINLETGEPFEGLEIKAKKIEPVMLDIAYNKIQEHSTVDRYYILSTFEDIPEETLTILSDKISKIRAKHGCEVIINGVFTTLKYFLRLTDSQSFLKNYVDKMAIDDALKYEHKKAWNELCSKL